MSKVHEDPGRRIAVKLPSERSFGVVWTVALGLIGGLPLTTGGQPRIWAWALGALLAVTTWLRPSLLRIPNLLWFRFGLLLGRIVSPIVLGVIFFGVITPFGMVMRLSGRDPLRLRVDPAAGSYWVPRKPPGPPPESMKDQF